MIRLTSDLSTNSSVRLTSEHTTSASKNFGSLVAAELACVYGGLASVMPKLLKISRLSIHILFSPFSFIQLLNIYMFNQDTLKTLSLAFRSFSSTLSKAYTLPAGCHLPRRFTATAHLLTTSESSDTILNLTLDGKVDH